MSLHFVKWNAQLLDVPKSIKRFPIKHMEMKFINVCTVFVLGSNQVVTHGIFFNDWLVWHCRFCQMIETMQKSRIASKRNTKERGYRIDSSTSCLTVVFLSKKDVQVCHVLCLLLLPLYSSKQEGVRCCSLLMKTSVYFLVLGPSITTKLHSTATTMFCFPGWADWAFPGVAGTWECHNWWSNFLSVSTQMGDGKERNSIYFILFMIQPWMLNILWYEC